LMAPIAITHRMRGTYCLMISLPQKSKIKVGSLGTFEFEAGLYSYVGSALSGIEARVGRHKSKVKKKRWHIDYLLAKADVMSVIAVPSDKKAVECAVAKMLLECEDAIVPLRGFGSSDCSCRSHLIFFGDSDPERITEEIAMRISMFPDLYQKKRD
jgi:Uri superfamily endonuclease